jgi:hypothetical protein
VVFAYAAPELIGLPRSEATREMDVDGDVEVEVGASPSLTLGQRSRVGYARRRNPSHEWS